MREFEIRQADIAKEKKDLPQFLFLGAHTDDDAMGKLTKELDSHGYGLTIGTMTDSSNYDTDLIEIRWKEAIASGKVGGITEVRRMEVFDGRLKYYIDSGVSFAGELIDEIKPVAIITPHPLDPHPDHAAAFTVGEMVAGDRTPHYTTDTIYGVGHDGSLLVPDLYLPISEEQAEFENDIYRANTSQIVDSDDVRAVMDMTRRRGRDIGVEHAIVAFEQRVVFENPLRDIFNGALAKR